MQPENADPSNPATPPATEPHAEDRWHRKLNRPYFEMRTPDAQSLSYLEGDAYRLVTDKQEGINAFLAEARLVVDPKTKGRSIQYRIDPDRFKNPRPLDAIPASQLELFEKAAKDFYDKAAADKKEVSPYQKFIRQSFRLPDIDKEPDAYWVHGENFERKLLVLWGCEKEYKTGLPLMRHPSVNAEGQKTVADKLRSRVIGWAQMQKDALTLISMMKEPISRFLCTGELDAKGKLKAIKYQGKTIDPAKFRPLKRLLPPETQAFTAAAKEFYAKATTTANAYEKDVRTSFQLPDPDKHPECYLVYGGWNSPKVMILCEGTLPKEDTLPLTPAPELGIPVAVEKPDPEFGAENKPQPLTISDKLRRVTFAYTKMAAIALAAAAVVIIALVLAPIDKTPPKIKKVEASEQPKTLMVEFDEAMDPASVIAGAKTAPNFVVRSKDAKEVVEVVSAELSAKSNKIIVVKTSAELADGRDYTLAVKNVTDHSMKKNRIAPNTEYQFQYNDSTPAQISSTSSGLALTDLEIEFNKKLEPNTAADKQNYAIAGMTFNGARVAADGKTVILAAASPFTIGNSYTLEVNGVKDGSRRGNPISKLSRTFVYRDERPPQIAAIRADRIQVQVEIEYSEPVDPASALATPNYKITGPGGAALAIVRTEAAGPSTVKLTTAVMKPGQEYKIAVTEVKDKAAPPNAIAKDTSMAFYFTGQVDDKKPEITKVQVADANKGVVVTFSEPVDATSLRDPKGYFLHLMRGDTPQDVSRLITEAKTVAENPQSPYASQAHLTFSEGLQKPAVYAVGVKSLKDVIGNVHENASGSVRTEGFYINIRLSEAWASDDGGQIVLEFKDRIEADSLKGATFAIDGAQVKRADLATTSDRQVILTLAAPMRGDRVRGTYKNVGGKGNPQLDSDSFDHPARRR